MSNFAVFLLFCTKYVDVLCYGTSSCDFPIFCRCFCVLSACVLHVICRCSVFLLPVFFTSYGLFLCSFFLCSAFNNVNGFYVLSACVLPVSCLRFCVLIFRVPSDCVSVFMMSMFLCSFCLCSVRIMSMFLCSFYLNSARFTSISTCVPSAFCMYYFTVFGLSPLCTNLFCTCLHSHCHLLFCSGCFLIFVPPVSDRYFLSKGTTWEVNIWIRQPPPPPPPPPHPHPPPIKN
jgi:hypothetical protein